MDSRWVLNAACRQQPIHKYWAENLPPNRERFQASILCAGCPVVSECAEDALQPIDMRKFIEYVSGVDVGEDDQVFVSGVVRAGVVIPEQET